MQFLNYVFLQLDEACRYIKYGRLAQLRLALLLLDNAAEIQMERCVNNQLEHEGMQELIRKRVLQIPEDKRTDSLQDLVEWQPLSSKEKRVIVRYFDEKVQFLSERAKQLDTHIAGPLSYLHRYRNEAYHHAKVRKETIETAARMLLDINCELLLSLSRGLTSYDPNEDYSWIEERFGVESDKVFYQNDFVTRVVKELRANIELDDQSIGQLLADHLHSRIQDVFDALDFIVENTRCPDLETAIRDSYSYGEARRKKNGSSKHTLLDFEMRHSVDFLNKLITRLP